MWNAVIQMNRKLHVVMWISLKDSNSRKMLTFCAATLHELNVFFFWFCAVSFSSQSCRLPGSNWQTFMDKKFSVRYNLSNDSFNPFQSPNSLMLKSPYFFVVVVVQTLFLQAEMHFVVIVFAGYLCWYVRAVGPSFPLQWIDGGSYFFSRDTFFNRLISSVCTRSKLTRKTTK